MWQPKEDPVWPWVLVIVVTMVGMVYFLTTLSPPDPPQVAKAAKDPDVLDDLSSLKDPPQSATKKANYGRGPSGELLPDPTQPPPKKHWEAKFKREGDPLPQRKPPAERATADGGTVDLVIVDIVQDGPYVFVIYKNAGQGGGGSGDDFGITLGANGKMFAVNPSYRRYVPKPGVSVCTGGYALHKLGIEEGWMGTFTAVIDPEMRVKESNENNNTMMKTIRADNIKEFTKQGSLPPRGPQRRL